MATLAARMVIVVIARPVLGLVAISAVEGLGLVGYAVYDTVQTARVGITGPSDVSNSTAVGLQIALFAIFGLAMLVVANAWRGPARWVRGPFVLGQLMALAVGIEVAGGAGFERVAGIAVALLAAVGLILAFSPGVVRLFEDH